MRSNLKHSHFDRSVAPKENTDGPVVVLQGPVGGFFGAFARHLEAANIGVLNVQFNLADQCFKSGGQNIVYRGTHEAWGEWLTALCAEHKPRAIIMFGDRRPIHIVACDVAAALDIPLYSFEEGYLRPDFVTFERGGNNARSPLPRDAAVYLRETAPLADVAPVGQSFWSMSAAASAYFTVLRLGRRRFPHYTHHRVRSLRDEIAQWTRNVMRKLSALRSDTALQSRLIRTKSKQFFMVALQVHDDLQALHHGAGWSQDALITAAIQSFAAHAPATAELIVRSHPLDRGHSDYAALAQSVATRSGVSERVHLMQSGHGPTLVTHAAGLITVNSTMALSALHHGCPVYALGKSFYRIPGLVADGDGIEGLDAFWGAPQQPDPVLVKGLRAHLRRHALIEGSFYRRRQWPRMIDAILKRLAADGVIGNPAPSCEPDTSAPPLCETAPLPPQQDKRVLSTLRMPAPRPAA